MRGGAPPPKAARPTRVGRLGGAQDAALGRAGRSNSTDRNASTQAALADYLASVPIKYRGLVARALAGELSPRQAIKAKCLGCTGFVRADVVACTAILCELHPLRPYQCRREGGMDDLEGASALAEGSPHGDALARAPEPISVTPRGDWR